MKIDDTVLVLTQALSTLRTQQETLRQLDAAVGDGDLGITADRGCAAVDAALQTNPPTSVTELLRSAAAAFASANPSTMAALIGAGLLAAAKVTVDDDSFTRHTALRIGNAAYEKIAQRGKAGPGDKTVLDAFGPSLKALESAGDGEILSQMIEAAQRGADQTTQSAGRRGRASWVGERGIGHPDPGAMFYIFFLTALQDAVRSQTPKQRPLTPGREGVALIATADEAPY